MQFPFSAKYPTPLRFGTAVAKVRSRFQKRHVAAARRFLRAAVKDKTSKCDARPSINNMWMKHANLEPIIKFLSK